MLAGGRSRRFSGDKLRARIGSRSVLRRVVDAVAPLASELLVATSTDSRSRELAADLPPSARLVADVPSRWGEGPAATIASVREQFREGSLLFVPGDVPWIESRALRRFVERSARGPGTVASPFWPTGETEHLIQWHRSPRSLQHLPWRRRAAIAPRRASEFLRSVPFSRLIPISSLTTTSSSFAHVTVPADLLTHLGRGRLTGPRSEKLLSGAPKRHYRAAHSAWQEGDRGVATREFVAEARWYERHGLRILAAHAVGDSAYVSGTVAAPEETVNRSPEP